MSYVRRENRSNKIPKILTLPIFSHGDTSMLTLPILLPMSHRRDANPLFGVEILANTLAIGAVKFSFNDDSLAYSNNLDEC